MADKYKKILHTWCGAGGLYLKMDRPFPGSSAGIRRKSTDKVLSRRHARRVIGRCGVDS